MAASRPPLLVLTGPTGTGKSELALQVAERCADWQPIEIVSVDSALVYRGMDIGSAKPDLAARARVAHHLIDIRDPAQSYSAGEFVRDARVAISQIQARGALPLLVGGTMLYLRALREGLARLPPASAAMRQTIGQEARSQGWPALHAQLLQVDPAAAARIQPTDAQRLQRALEVYRLTGRALSDWQRDTPHARDEFTWLRFALLPRSREELRTRLRARFDAMLEAGLLAEVQRLYARADLTAEHPAVRAVGYRQLWRYCAGECSLEQAREQGVVATSQLAKRQLTWLRRESDLTVFEVPEEGLCDRITTAIRAAVQHDRSGA